MKRFAIAEGIRRAIGQPPSDGTQLRNSAGTGQCPRGQVQRMLTLIRTINSEGLKAVLRIDEWHDTTERDIQSSHSNGVRNTGASWIRRFSPSVLIE
jgi:hypothetical protein